MQVWDFLVYCLHCVLKRAHLEQRGEGFGSESSQSSLLSCFQVQPMVLLKHHQQFEEWHNRWLEENVTMEAVDVVQDWLMGDEDEEMVPCKTTCETVNVHGVPVNRYRVQYSRRPASP